MHSVGIERDQWHEVGQIDVFISSFGHLLACTNTSQTRNQDFFRTWEVFWCEGIG